MSDFDPKMLERRVERERQARREAERLLEEKSREAYEANRRLARLAEQTKAIVETAAEGIITYDQHGTVGLMNLSARKLFGFVADHETGNLRNLFPSDSSQLFVCEATYDQKIDRQEPATDLELEAVRADGSRFQVEVAVSCFMQDGQPFFTAVVRDLSKRRNLEAQRQQSKKMESVGQMAAGIAHEINTPLQYVSNNIQFLEGAFEDLSQLVDLFVQLTDAVRNNGDSTDLLQEIDRQSELVDLSFLREEFPGAIHQSNEGIDRVVRVVRTMKEFSQPMTEAKTHVDLNRVIENALTVSSHLFKNVARIETQLDHDLPPFPAVEGKLQQALLNVLSNAADAIAETRQPEDGCIRIATVQGDETVELRIEDNGPGIPQEHQERVFDPFFTTKEVGKGIGQGLSFVYDVVVNKHCGEVSFTSTPLGGTTFLITLPVQSRELAMKE